MRGGHERKYQGVSTPVWQIQKLGVIIDAIPGEFPLG
jgi:hypothetical protein